MQVRRLTIAAAIVALGALVFVGGAQACSCARMAPEEALREADAAFAGRLVEVVPQSQLKATYRYRVQRVYKGGPGIWRGGTVAVISSRQSASCGLPAAIGRDYGLMLARHGDRWVGGLCGLLSPSFNCAS